MATDTLKILVVQPFFYPHRGGSQKYSEEIHAHLINQHPNVAVDVLCYNTDGAEEYEEYRGLRIYRVPCWNVIPGRFTLPHPIKLLANLYQLAKNDYAVVNTHIRFFDPCWWVWLYARLIGARSVFTGHVASHPIHQNKVVQIVAKLVDLTIAKWALKHYDLVTVTNQAAQKFFAETFGITNSTLVYGGVDIEFFSPGPKSSAGRIENPQLQEPPKRLIPKTDEEIATNTVLITYAGRLIWTKGITYLYEALRGVLSRTEENAKAVLAGPGELEEELGERIRKDGLEDKITLTGNLDYQQIRNLLAISDIFIHPSHHNEGFPNAVLEAMAAECFVIATDNAGTREVVNEETGRLIPQKDAAAIKGAVDWALSHPEERRTTAGAGRKLVTEKFDWRNISEDYHEALLNLVETVDGV